MLTFSHPLAQTVALLRGGQLCLLDYLEVIYERLETVETRIKSLLPEPGRRERLAREARGLLAREGGSGARPALFGVPVAVKDILPVEGLPTRAGSALPPELFAGPEAACVSRLRSAGALILGKSHTDEFAYCEPGPTRNPHHLAHSPGGSSSGSAAAVAAGLCPLALGTQTSRSIIAPAAFCGVVGLKPSYDRIPTDGLIFLAPSLDTLGLFTQDVVGCRLAASLLYKDWDPPNISKAPVLGVLSPDFLREVMPEALEVFRAQTRQLAASGYTLKTLHIRESALAEAYTNASCLLHGEMAQVHARWVAQYRDRYRPRTLEGIYRGQKVSPRELDAARAGRGLFRALVEEEMANAGVDFLLTPSSIGPAPEGLDREGWGAMNIPWSYAGLPCLSIPGGRAPGGLPLGLQLVGRFYADELLLIWGEEIEHSLRSGAPLQMVGQGVLANLTRSPNLLLSAPLGQPRRYRSSTYRKVCLAAAPCGLAQIRSPRLGRRFANTPWASRPEWSTFPSRHPGP